MAPKIKNESAILFFKKILDSSTLFRSIFNSPFYKVDRFVYSLSKKAEGKRVLDVGAGECPHKKYFAKSEYFSQDICDKVNDWGYKNIDIKSEIYNIPVEDNSFDFLICTEVLEHLKYPDKAMGEFNRILKKEGELWLSVPFNGVQEHQTPYDYFRYTSYGLTTLGEDNGFIVKKIEPTSGGFVCSAMILKNLLPGMVENNKQLYLTLNILQIPFIIIPLTILLFLDKLDKNKRFASGYMAVYIKK